MGAFNVPVILYQLYAYLTDACRHSATRKVAHGAVVCAGRPTFYQTASPESRSRLQLQTYSTLGRSWPT